MRDLTQGSITRHLLGMAAFIGVGMIVQTLYFLVDLYFVSHLGEHAIAGVSTAGPAWMVVMALSQTIAVGALALISQALGRKDDADAGRVFNQTVGMSLCTSLLVLVLGYSLGPIALGALGADAETVAAGRSYLTFFLPSLALMFPMAALGTALRAAGVAGPPMMIQTGSVAVNAALAPVLIAGWGTGRPMGVAGAGLASTIAVAAALAVTLLLFTRMQSRLKLERAEIKPQLKTWSRILGIGLPSGGEFLLMAVIASVVYAVIRDYGAHAQAGFGVGSRVMQSIFLPAMAVAFAAAPIAGQNFGARQAARVRETFRQSALIGGAIMVGLTLLCQISPELLVRPFVQEPQAAAVAAAFLRIASWNFVATGLVFTCSGMFQALGDTRPAFFSSASRLLTFVAPALWLTHQPGVPLETFWKLSVASVFMQALLSIGLLRLQLRKKLDQPVAAEVAPAPAG
ncbi:MATE family efflux transporter [Caulobacter sp. 17J80-11]|uniref:MATE family efflux transporter n=1 Tax=Caulobacter sp. 17J80-11 TaxID=2763502 RepID=UPI001653C636|nr:MATE family efflux transporter [Caulobacter sp. 17J80-11]MBC6981043.1 MATE family efflux transporter [Caulobacter sp. 17J80-11]